MQEEELIIYEPVQGTFTSRNSLRIITPTEQGLLILSINKKRYTLHAARTAILLMQKRTLEPSEIVLYRNMNRQDYRYINLMVVKRTLYHSIMNAYRNLQSGLKITPHKQDMFAYVVQWQHNGIRNRKVLSDLVLARRLYLKLQLKYAKLLNKYCVFD